MLLHPNGTVPRFASCLALALALSPAALSQQAKPNLLQYIEGLRWDASAKGTLVAVIPNARRPKPNTQGLPAYDRKLVTIGSLNTIVPIKMIVIDDSMKTPPNMYDGLPREAKVLYLLTTLDSNQMDKVTGTGLGLGDLRQDQRPVFLSLLPNPFKWRKGIVDENGMPNTKASGVLTDDQRFQVRLRIAKGISFNVGLADGSPGYTMHDTLEDYGDPGTTYYSRDDEADFDSQEAFGIRIRSEADNQLKKANLDYLAPSYRQNVPLQPHEPIAKLLQRIGAATGVEIYADMRVGSLDVASFGAKAPAGEILQAVAMGVTGTYRRVGPAYVLASDLTGQGTRKLRLSLWQSDIQKEVWKRMSEWRRQSKKLGALTKSSYYDDNSLAPNAEVRKNLDQFKSATSDDEIDTATLPANLRGFLDRINKRYSNQQVRTDRVSMEAFLSFGFVLPDGNRLHPEIRGLGQAWIFDLPEKRTPPPNDQGPKEPFAMAESTSKRNIVISIENPNDVARVVQTAKVIGFKEIWVQTRSSEVLTQLVKGAKEQGIETRLVVRPWLAAPNADPGDLDQTLAGNTYKDLVALCKNSATFQEFAERDRHSTFRFQPTVPPGPDTPSRWQNFVALAKTPDLQGVVVLDPRPRGYEPLRSREMYMEAIIPESLNEGYSSDLRLRFLRQFQVDPVDIVPPELFFDSDLRQPFFLNDNLRASSSVYDGRDQPNAEFPSYIAKWDKFRAVLNQTATSQLLNTLSQTLGDRPLIVAYGMKTVNNPSEMFTSVKPWRVGEPLPEFENSNARQQVPMSDAMALVPFFFDPTDVELQNERAIALALARPDFKYDVNLDLTASTTDQALKILGYWFKASTN